MKTKKKGLLAVLLTVCLAFTAIAPMTAFAYNIGDKLGDVRYSDIIAYIDGYAVPSYNINGNLAVRVTDISNYGLDTRYDNAARASYITYSATKTPSPITVEQSTGKTGAIWQPYVYTDIVAYVNGKKIDSWNVGGNLVIPFSALEVFGERYYDNATRTSRLTLDRNKVTGSVQTVPPVTTPTSAPNTPTKLGDVLYTNTQTYINGYRIPCYTINGNLVVTVEALKSYGFATSWNGNTSTTNVTLNTSGKLTQLSFNPGSAGASAGSYTASTVKVTLNGTLVDSFAFENTYAIYFSALEMFGQSETTGNQRVLWTVANISGRITSATGEALRNAVVQLIDANGAVAKNVPSDSNGNYTFTQIPFGTYYVEASIAGYASKRTTSFSATGTVTEKNISLTKDAVTLSGTVKGSDTAAALSGATVTLKSGTTVKGTATTNASGTYLFSDLTAGTYTLTVTKTGYTTYDGSVSVSASTSRDVTLQTVGYAISGRVNDYTSGYAAPISGVTLRIAKSTTPSSYLAQTQTSDASGNFTFTGLENTTYVIVATKAGYTPTNSTTAYSVNSSAAADIRMTTATNTLTGSVYSNNTNWGTVGGYIYNAKVEAVVAANAVAALTATAALTPVYTDQYGGYTLSLGSTNRTYYIRVTSPNNTSYVYVDPTPVVVTSGYISGSKTTETKNITVGGTYSISGTIMNIPAGTTSIRIIYGDGYVDVIPTTSTTLTMPFTINNNTMSTSDYVYATAYPSYYTAQSSNYVSAGTTNVSVNFYNGYGATVVVSSSLISPSAQITSMFAWNAVTLSVYNYANNLPIAGFQNLSFSGTNANTAGRCTISNLPAGSYSFVISYPAATWQGIGSVPATVTIDNSTPITINLAINDWIPYQVP